MPRPTFVNCAFEPALCPLLQGLPPEEQRRRMETDPLIRNCRLAIEKGGSYPAQCGRPAAPEEPPAKRTRSRIAARA